LWLDEERQLSEDEERRINDLAREYLNKYGNSLSELGLSKGDRCAVKSLEMFSKACWKLAERWHNDPDPFKRDCTWLQLVLADLANHEGGWAIIVAGALHVSKDYPGSLRSRLERAGYRCTAEILSPHGAWNNASHRTIP
ncbi:MAG: hypothetical protein ABIH46_01450, partial [Chloroflexota bacterium]